MIKNTLDTIEKRYEELNGLLSRPEVISNQENFQKYAKEHSDLCKTVEVYNRYKKVEEEIGNNKEIINTHPDDPELINLAKEELVLLENEKQVLNNELILLITPKDPLDEKNILLEIRAGTGGEEAGLFAYNLFRMYSKYAEKNKWSVEIMSSSSTDKGGFKEVIAMISGKSVYSKMKYESGTHRVQRVPETEAQGRIHTSAATVAILPEAEEIDVEINPNDIRIDVFRAGGHGGQSVNTTDSAVRITHLATGLVVSMQDEKSQHKNKLKGLKILRSRLMDKYKSEQDNARSKNRKNQVGSGDRSERIRTYNFPQGRVTDHRIGLTLYRLEDILEGNIDEIIEKLILYYQSLQYDNAAQVNAVDTE